MDTTPVELEEVLADLRAQVADLSERVARLEKGGARLEAAGVPATQGSEAEEQMISEEEVIAISAAVAAFLGERAHIRQIRLVSSPSWAQQGRVWVQASHRLYH